MAIFSFSDSATEHFFETGKISKGAGWSTIKSVVRRKLDMIHYANILEDLKSPPGSRLEALVGNLRGYHSIRVNDQWRIVFKWTASGPAEVQVCDYH
ncbi:MAG: type II toxin-antitoxin system RelE/ParE family toxin [Bdellovibrionales bacterium]|nr:type II toxin-antitoxin system RelE/ParE family toxin [Bdellovibrionales bacterium]